MAAFYLIATLMVLQGLLFSYCETTAMSSGNVTMSSGNVPMSTANVPMSTANVPMSTANVPMSTANVPMSTASVPMSTANVPMSTPNVTMSTAKVTMSTANVTGNNTLPTAVRASPSLGGNETTAMAGGTVTPVMVGNSVTTAVGRGTVTTVTTVAGGGGISSSKTTTTITSSVAPEKDPGPTVILILIVSTTNCRDENLLALNVSVQIDIIIVYKNERFPIKSVIIQSSSCNSALIITLKISFYSGIPSGKTIKGVFQAALKGGNIRNLTESNTNYTVTFTGVTLKYIPKAGECQAICCGGGGALTVQRECTPEDKCKGIEPDEKEEEGHCPKEEKGTCPDTCDEDDGSGGIHNSPSYALVTLLAIATFKTMFS